MKILLVRRGGEPYKGFLAFPASFVGKYQYLVDAKDYELFERFTFWELRPSDAGVGPIGKQLLMQLDDKFS